MDHLLGWDELRNGGKIKSFEIEEKEDSTAVNVIMSHRIAQNR